MMREMQKHRRAQRLPSTLALKAVEHDSSAAVVQSLQVADIQATITNAIASAKTFFDDLVKKGVGKLTALVQTGLTKAIDLLKTNLQSFSDSALALLKTGLKTVSDALKAMPAQINTAIAGFCKLLPAAVQSICTTGISANPGHESYLYVKLFIGAAQILANVTAFVAQLCTTGVAGLIDVANKTCTGAATKHVHATRPFASAAATTFSGSCQRRWQLSAMQMWFRQWRSR